MSDDADGLTQDLSGYEQDLVRTAADGEDVKDARERAVFRLLFTKAKLEAVNARNLLCVVDPTHVEQIRKLQNEVLRYEEIADWVRTAILNGEQAFKQLQISRGERAEEPEE